MEADYWKQPPKDETEQGLVWGNGTRKMLGINNSFNGLQYRLAFQWGRTGAPRIGRAFFNGLEKNANYRVLRHLRTARSIRVHRRADVRTSLALDIPMAARIRRLSDRVRDRQGVAMAMSAAQTVTGKD